MKFSNLAIALTTIAATSAQYEDVCVQNDGYCVVTCDKLSGVLVNSCNAENLTWECRCNDKNKTYPQEIYGNFPAELKKCNIKLDDCKEKADGDVVAMTKCQKDFVCLFKDPNDGKTANATTTTAGKTSTATTPVGAPNLNNSGFSNAPFYTLIATSVVALSLYL